jgi:hypothetical protein
MSRKFHLIALALVVAAAATSSAQASGPGSAPPKVDPLAVGYLTGLGLSPSEVKSWTVGTCSRASKPASCFAALDRTAASVKVDPLAVGYLMGRGLSPSEVRAWTVGICSQASKPALCYAPFERTAAPVSTSTRIVGPGGFDWGDASIGAGAALGAALLIAGLGAMLVVPRHHRRPPIVHA